LNARVIVLINYHSLKAERGRGVAEMLAICSHLFGSEENVKRWDAGNSLTEKFKKSILVCSRRDRESTSGLQFEIGRYKESIMLCVTNAPSGDTVEKIRRMLLKGAVTNSSIMKDLVER